MRTMAAVPITAPAPAAAPAAVIVASLRVMRAGHRVPSVPALQ